MLFHVVLGISCCSRYLMLFHVVPGISCCSRYLMLFQVSHVVPCCSRYLMLFQVSHVVPCCSRYLIPCTHVMVSQRRSVRHVDMYGKTAEKLLSLTPICCRATATSHRQTDVPPEGASISATRSPSNGISLTYVSTILNLDNTSH